MKVGILTFHRVLNYGAVLQTYALQQTMLGLGVECSVIDYRKKEFEKEYRNLKYNNISLHGIYHTIKCHMVRKKDRAFLTFIENYLHLSGQCSTKEELIAESVDCDILLTGSDQVFNYYTTNNDSHYFLDFAVNQTKCSYAASFGFNEFDSQYDNQIKDWLDDYSLLSVRENEAKQYLENILECNVELHCDPCFLLSKEEWKKFTKTQPEKDYILIYSVSKSNALIHTAEKLAKKYDLDILYIKYTYQYCGSAKVITDASPEDFVNLVNNARFVVTNLFHGVAFSMILEKDFYVCMQENVKTNSRLVYLLEKYNLESRKVEDVKEISNTKIDYDRVRASIEKERLVAKAYLKKIGTLI